MIIILFTVVFHQYLIFTHINYTKMKLKYEINAFKYLLWAK